MKRCSWILDMSSRAISSSDKCRYRFAICRCTGTVIPMNRSPCPYSPFAVLKNQARLSARSGFAPDHGRNSRARRLRAGIVRINILHDDVGSLSFRSANFVGLFGQVAGDDGRACARSGIAFVSILSAFWSKAQVDWPPPTVRSGSEGMLEFMV